MIWTELMQSRFQCGGQPENYVAWISKLNSATARLDGNLEKIWKEPVGYSLFEGTIPVNLHYIRKHKLLQLVLGWRFKMV